MTQEPAYIIHMNIRHYQAMLENPATTAVMRRTLTSLLAEAQAILADMESEAGDRVGSAFERRPVKAEC